jgi:hypothetical protein
MLEVVGKCDGEAHVARRMLCAFPRHRQIDFRPKIRLFMLNNRN